MVLVSDVRGAWAAGAVWTGTGFVLLVTGIRQPIDDVFCLAQVACADGRLHLPAVE